jgi:hypothetical protein
MRRSWVVLVTSMVLLASFSSGAEGRVVRRRRLAPGVKLTVIERRHPLQRIRVVSVALSAPSKIRPVLGSGVLPGLERTSGMARRRRAIVAINGDYARPSGRPVMAFARAGHPVQSALSWGRNFAVSANESQTFIGHSRLRVKLLVGGKEWSVARVNNGRPGDSGIVAFTPAGAELEKPPSRGCRARLRLAGLPHVSSAGPGLQIPLKVEVVRCGSRRLARRGGIVVAARRGGLGGERIRSLTNGQRIGLHWSLGWPGVIETLGGNPTLVEDGKVVVGWSTHPFFRRNPRTGVGTTSDGRVLMITVDGRQRRYSKGITLRGFARLFRSFGARWALNLDGGGSTTMVVRGDVVNRPSDGRERPVSSALLVLPKSSSGRLYSTSLADEEKTVSTSATWLDIATDPASTGGLTSALVERGMGLGRLNQVAARFNAASRSDL